MTVVTLRREKSELKYRQAKADKNLKDLHKEEPIKTFNYWKLVVNRFPYDIAYSVHHLLIPIRTFAEYTDMTLQEEAELNELRANYFPYEYHVVFENTKNARSVRELFHLHLAKYHKKRSEMKL
jgi:diadenosine tetraphosphate (Ap4A) HIT family hydrolase